MTGRSVHDLTAAEHVHLALAAYIGSLERRRIPVPDDLHALVRVITGTHGVAQAINAGPPRKTDTAWLSPQDTAREADVSIATVRRWLATGELASAKRGRIRRIARTDLQKFLMTDTEKENE